MTQLSVNVNKVATLRNQRKGSIPDVLHLARLALDGGAHGITIHPRPDERHIRYADIAPLALLVRERRREFNIEGNPFEGRYLEFVRQVRPHQATLVPDTVGQNTSDHGFALDPASAEGRAGIERLRPVVAELRALGVRVSLFVDPDPAAPAGAKAAGADRVELYTEGWADAFAADGGGAMLGAYQATAAAAQALGLGVNAGHDLNLRNLRPFLAKVPGVLEVSIGQALVADALEFGMAETVRRYLLQCGPAGCDPTACG